jgi:hypothetical protein
MRDLLNEYYLSEQLGPGEKMVFGKVVKTGGKIPRAKERVATARKAGQDRKIRSQSRSMIKRKKAKMGRSSAGKRFTKVRKRLEV